MSSATSGFFFWGIILEPVAKVSLISIKEKRGDDQRIMSSERRDRCIIKRVTSDKNSII